MIIQTTKEKIIFKQETISLLNNCYLRLKRLLANEYVKTRSLETANELKSLKENYEKGLKAIENWI